MKLKNLTNTLNGLSTENRFLWISNLILGIAIVALAFLVTQKQAYVVVMPPTLTEEAKLARNNASSGYKEAWGLYISELIGNVTPSNADFVVGAIEDVLDPEIYNKLRGFIAADIEDIKTKRLTTVFRPKTVSWEPESEKVFVYGEYEMKAPGGEPSTLNKTYEFSFAVENWMIMAVWFDAYEGVPRTMEVLRRRERLKVEG